MFGGFIKFMGAFFVLDSSLACFFLYTCAVCGRSFFTTSNIHTIHLLVINVFAALVIGGFVMLWVPFFRTRSIHTPFSPVYLCLTHH